MRLNSRLVGSLVVAALLSGSAHSADQSTPLVHEKKYVMGTVFDILVYDASPAHARDAIDAAFREIVRLDGVMSNYKSDSDLSRLNRCAHFQVCTIDPDLYRVIEESLRYSKLSEGKFDTSVGPLVDFWKAVMRGERGYSSAEEQKLRSCVGYDNIELRPPNQIEFHSACLRIDLGAIGKGYAVDRAAEILRTSHISNALINAGGSTLFAMGAPPDQLSWMVQLRDPSGRIGPQVALSDSSVSTSEQTPPSLLGNNKGGHIIDPDTGTPVASTAAISAVAKTATASDALSTTLFLLGPERGKHLIDSIPGTAAIWISPGGEAETASSGPQIILEKQDREHGSPRSALAARPIQ